VVDQRVPDPDQERSRRVGHESDNLVGRKRNTERHERRDRQEAHRPCASRPHQSDVQRDQRDQVLGCNDRQEHYRPGRVGRGIEGEEERVI
jgi:hypothetical protein